MLAEVRWGYFRTRKRFLLSRFPERWRIFYAQPPAAGADDPWRPRREGRVTCFTVPFLKPATTSTLYNRLAALPAARGVIEGAADAWLRRQLRRLGVDPRPVVLASNIYCPRTLSRLPRKLLCYDFNDHPLQFASVPAWAGRYFERTLEQAELLFVVSEHYRRRLAERFPQPIVRLGNGVEMARFEAPRPAPPALDTLQRLLPSLLRYEDRNSMAFSIETRLPFLDYRLVEFVFSLPDRELLDRGTSKAILRRSLADRIPAPVLERRDKMGFETPADVWLRGRFAGEVRRRLTAPGPFQEWVDGARLGVELERYLAGERDIGLQVWRWLSLETWARRFVAVDPRITERPAEVALHAGRHRTFLEVARELVAETAPASSP